MWRWGSTLVLAALVASCTGGPVAEAATVGVRYDDGGSCATCSIEGVLVISAPDRAPNRLEATALVETENEEGNYETTVRVVNRTGILTPRTGCRAVDLRTADCSVELFGLTQVTTGPGDDQVDVVLPVRARVRSGAGADRIVTGSENDTIDSGPGRDDVQSGGGTDVIADPGGTGQALRGGSGRDDTLDLSSRRASLRVDLARGTLETNSERSLVSGFENVVPGRGADVILGDGGRNIVEEALDEYGSEVLSEKARPTGDDLFIGRGGRDGFVSLGGNDRMLGLSGADRMRCQVLIVQRCRLAGGAGDDHLRGSGGPDRLSGGPGADSVDGDAGNDRLLLRDGARDRADGGRGVDSARADRRDALRSVERR